MKDIISQLNKMFESRIRLGIMSVLMVNDWVDFSVLKETLGVTDGNLASHISALEKAGLIEVRKEFVAKKPKTSFRVTLLGRKEFAEHLAILGNIIKQQ